VRPGSDRLGRIAGHILSQQSFYPLYPPAEEMNLDLELWAKYAALEVTPHILILPSDLRCFVKVSNCLQHEIHVSSSHRFEFHFIVPTLF
jgi:DNA polymerase alpha subunit B